MTGSWSTPRKTSYFFVVRPGSIGLAGNFEELNYIFCDFTVIDKNIPYLITLKFSECPYSELESRDTFFNKFFHFLTFIEPFTSNIFITIDSWRFPLGSWYNFGIHEGLPREASASLGNVNQRQKSTFLNVENCGILLLPMFVQAFNQAYDAWKRRNGPGTRETHRKIKFLNTKWRDNLLDNLRLYNWDPSNSVRSRLHPAPKRQTKYTIEKQRIRDVVAHEQQSRKR